METYLEAAYQRAFDGRIRSHYPELMSVRDGKGDIQAAVGFRLASGGPLFLEQYLDAPIEALLQIEGEAAPRRAAIAEIGNLAATTPGASQLLFLALARHLHWAGCAYVAATATRSLRRSFSRAGFATRTLAPAAASRLADGGADWGSYFKSEPRVLAGPIAPALPQLAQTFGGAPCREASPHLRPVRTTEARQ